MRTTSTTPNDFTWSRALRQATTTETGQYAALVDWVRRRTDVPAGSTPFPYASLAVPMIWLFVFGSAVELVAVHVLLEPWPVPRWILLVLGVWGLVWMVGFLAAYRTRPHVLGDEVLRVRAGSALVLDVPLALVAQVSTVERDLESSVRLTSVVDDERGRWCGVGVSGRTNLQLRLRSPLVLDDPRLGRTGTVGVDAVGLWVDDPRAARHALAAALADRH